MIGVTYGEVGIHVGCHFVMFIVVGWQSFQCSTSVPSRILPWGLNTELPEKLGTCLYGTAYSLEDFQRWRLHVPGKSFCEQVNVQNISNLICSWDAERLRTIWWLSTLSDKALSPLFLTDNPVELIVSTTKPRSDTWRESELESSLLALTSCSHLM